MSVHRPAHFARALIIGASSGIGESIARQLAADGTSVILVARRGELLEAIASDLNEARPGSAEVLTCDVMDVTASQAAFQRVVLSGPVDLVVYSSGIMPQGTKGAFPTDEDIRAVQTNLIGAIVWLNDAATYFQERGAGTIIGISSIAGERGRRANPVYGATKAAFSTYLESLRHRLHRHGVKVVTVKPGPVRTAMLGDRNPPAAPTADQAARQIIRAAKRGRSVVYVPPIMRIVAFVLRHAPGPLIRRVKV